MSWLSDIFIPSKNMSSTEQQSNYERIAQLNAERYAAREAAGTVTPAAQAEATSAGPLESQDLAAAQGFAEGAKEGLSNVLAAPGKVVGSAGSLSGQLLWGILKNIPWWLWLGAGVALFVWMGGLSLLRGKLART